MQTDTELQALTVKELYALAQAHGIVGRSAMRKAELVDALEMSESYQQTLEPETDAPELTRERAEELVLAAEAANDWHDATDAEILDEIVPANVAPGSIETSGSMRPDVAAAYRIVIGEADPVPADEGGETAGGPAYVYCRDCSLESVSAGVPYCEGCTPEPEYTVTVPKQYVNAPWESEITLGITALGGGTLGYEYTHTKWQGQVRENSTVVLIFGDLRSNATPATHADMARTLSAFLSADAETLAYGDRDSLDTEYTQAQRDFIESYGERLGDFARNSFDH